MSFKGGEMVFGRKGLGATLAVLAALFTFALFTDPAWAQAALAVDKIGPTGPLWWETPSPIR